MKLFFLIAFVGVTANASIFEFKDLKGYEKCLKQDHLLEKGGGEERILRPVEIQRRCVESAVKHLKAEKDKKKILDFIKITKRGTGHENAIELVGVLATADAKACNEMEAYEVIRKAISHPKDYPSVIDSYYEDAKAVIKNCMKDAEFKKDFIEEKDSSDSYIADNACAMLMEQKLIKECRKGE